MLEAEGYTERLDTLTLVRAPHRDDVAPQIDSTDT
jgi:hypothetical protein